MTSAPARSSPSPGAPAPRAQIDRLVEAALAGGPEKSAARLVRSGQEAYAIRALSARAASRTLDLMYYAWEDCALGRSLAAEALAAADRGVRVRMLIDDFATAGVDAALLALQAHPRIEVRRHNPLRLRGAVGRLAELLLRFAHLNHRMHNKAWIVDGRLAIVGGRNIGERYFEAGGDVANFRDLDIAVLGAAAEQAEAIFESYWTSPVVACSRGLSETPERIGRARAAMLAATQDRSVRAALELCADDGLEGLVAGARLRRSDGVEVVADPPGKWRGQLRPGRRDRSAWIVTRLTQLIGGARREIRLVSPYFVPGRRFSRLLTRKARAGTRVEIVTNSLAATDVVVVHGGYMRYRRRLLRGGVRLRELRADAGEDADRSVFGSSGASLHTKASLFDGRRGFVGSFNLDPRSASVNTEMGVLFDDAALAADLAAEIDRLAAPRSSWDVRLEGAALVWRAGDAVCRAEPESTWRQRLTARLVGWLPIEQEL
ncbi:MAG: phospholipase D family protein [Methylobacteriaceae bacterium]|nr:phospholipase D family protein [Methylobacteriaceae bacterium]